MFVQHEFSDNQFFFRQFFSDSFSDLLFDYECPPPGGDCFFAPSTRRKKTKSSCGWMEVPVPFKKVILNWSSLIPFVNSTFYAPRRSGDNF